VLAVLPRLNRFLAFVPLRDTQIFDDADNILAERRPRILFGIGRRLEHGVKQVHRIHRLEEARGGGGLRRVGVNLIEDVTASD
jgi:hypothetical protein